MFKNFLHIFNYFSKSEKRNFLKLQLYVIFMTILEVISILMIGAFVGLLNDPYSFSNNSVLNYFYTVSNFSNISDFIFLFGVAVLILLLISSIFSVLTIWRLNNFSSNFSIGLGNKLFQYYIQRDWIFFTKDHTSEMLKKVSQEVNRVSISVIGPIFQLIARIILVLAIFFTVLLYEPIMAISVVLVLGFVYFLMYKTVRTSLDVNGSVITEENSKRFSLMSEALGSIKEILISYKQSFFIDKFSTSGEKLAKSIAMNQSLAFIPRYLMEFLMFGGIIMVAIVSIKFSSVLNGENIEIVAIFGVAGLKILPSIQQIYQNIALIRGNFSAFKAIKNDLDQSIRFKNLNLKSFNNAEFHNVIKFSDVDYYLGSKRILSNINFEIVHGQSVGIVGGSGAGKTTLLNLILGLIKPQSGKITIDGRTLRTKKSYFNLQRQIGFVSQDIFLLGGSILENIAFGIEQGNIDMAKVWEVIEIADLKNFIESLDSGIHSVVGERGVNISGGQIQRIAIARALYKKSKILLLDEATSALDTVTESKIVNSIRKLQNERTIIIVAHRLSTVKNCDKILLLENGKIEDSGTYAELISRNENFRKMVNNNVQ